MSLVADDDVIENFLRAISYRNRVRRNINNLFSYILIALGVITFIAAFMLIGVLRGWILNSYYGWFILPNFHGLPRIGTLSFVGISLFLGLLIPTGYGSDLLKQNENNSRHPSVQLIKNAFIHALFLLGAFVFGWVWHLFI